MYQVNNVSKDFQNWKYIVIRKVFNDKTNENEYWYYGGYNNIVLAQEIINKELNNGILITPDLIKVLWYGY